MTIPKRLIPSDQMKIKLPAGSEVCLPVCRPKFARWTKQFEGFTFGNKPLVESQGEACFAELAILHLLIEDGWEGAWVETYGGLNFLKSMPCDWKLKKWNIKIPEQMLQLLNRIQHLGGTCFDIFAWHGDEILFVEAKRAKSDKLTRSQIRFIQSAVTIGIQPSKLLIAEWSCPADL